MARTALWVNSNTRCRRDGAIGVHEFENLRKAEIGQGRRRKIAEQADVAVLQQQPAHHLHAAQHREIVELRHQRAGFGISEEIGRPATNSPLSALQPRHRFVIAHLALRQRHDRLQIEIDLAGLDGAADRCNDAVAVEAGESRDFAFERRGRGDAGVGRGSRGAAASAAQPAAAAGGTGSADRRRRRMAPLRRRIVGPEPRLPTAPLHAPPPSRQAA